MCVIEKFEKLSKNNKIEVLWAALDFMEQSNTRSQTEWVELAMNE